MRIVVGAAFSPDGTLLVANIFENKTPIWEGLKIWDVKTGALRRQIEDKKMYPVTLARPTFSPGGSFLIASGFTSVVFWLVSDLLAYKLLNAEPPAPDAVEVVRKFANVWEDSEQPRVMVTMQSEATEEQLALLAKLPLLTHLDFGPMKDLTDAGLAHLKGLTGLRTLTLSRSQKITDTGLSALAGLTKLQALFLFNLVKVTDAGLVHLKGLTGLKNLDLSQTAVTDKGLDHLQGLTGLQSLWLNMTKVTAEGVAKLKKVLPKANIVRE